MSYPVRWLGALFLVGACGGARVPEAQSETSGRAPTAAHTSEPDDTRASTGFSTFGELVAEITRRDTQRDLRGGNCLLRPSHSDRFEIVGDLAPALRPSPSAPESLSDAAVDYAGLISRFGNLVVHPRHTRYFALLSSTSLYDSMDLVLFSGERDPQILDARTGDALSFLRTGQEASLVILTATAATSLRTIVEFAENHRQHHVFAFAVAVPDLGGNTIDFRARPNRIACLEDSDANASENPREIAETQAAVAELRTRIPSCIANTPASLPGVLHVRFGVGATGVRDACVLPDSTAPSELDACVVDLLRSMPIRARRQSLYEVNLRVEAERVSQQLLCVEN